MVIQKMNIVLVKHSRWLFGGITILIIISFVAFFTPGVGADILFGFGSKGTMGKCFGKPVTRDEVVSCARLRALAIAANWGVPPSSFMEDAQRNAFETVCMLSAASKMGIRISDAEVAEYIKGIPAFAGQGGAFDFKKFDAYQADIMAPAGFSGADLDEAIRQLLTVMALSRQASGMVMVTPDEVEQFQISMNEKFDAKLVSFSSDSFKDSIKLEEKDAMSFHSASPNLFMLPPKAKICLVQFKYSDYEKQAPTPDALIKDYYDRNQEEFKKGDAVTPLAEATPEIRRRLSEGTMRKLASTAARAFREELYEKTDEMKSNASQLEAFKKLAKGKGIAVMETGWFDLNSGKIAGVGTEPQLVMAVASATKSYPVSPVVQGGQSAFVAVLVDRKESTESQFQDVKEKVKEKLLLVKSLAAAREAAADFALKASESKDMPAMLAAKGRFKLESLEQFSPSKPPAAMNSGLILEMAMETSVGKLSAKKDTNDGAMLLYVERRTPPTKEDMEKGKDEAANIYKAQKERMSMDALQKWIMSNSQSYIAAEDKAARQ